VKGQSAAEKRRLARLFAVRCVSGNSGTKRVLPEAVKNTLWAIGLVIGFLVPHAGAQDAGSDAATDGGVETAEDGSSWTAVESPEPVLLSTITLLQSGLVLYAGGYTSALPMLYDPSAGTSSPTSPMTTGIYGRTAHSATVLQSGKVLLAGGLHDVIPGGGSDRQELATAELYDPVANTWTATGNMTTTRSLQSATLLPNGAVLVAGGDNYAFQSPLATAELYDPAAGTWSPTGSMATARVGQIAILLSTGKVLVIGGDNAAPWISAELFDPSVGAWTATGWPAFGFELQTATLLVSGKVLATASDGASEIYDPSTGIWSLTASTTTARTASSASLLPSGRVLVAGGWNAYNTVTGETYLASAEVYDPRFETWTPTASMNVARSDQTAMVLLSGKVFVVGGDSYLGVGDIYTEAAPHSAYMNPTATPAAGGCNSAGADTPSLWGPTLLLLLVAKAKWRSRDRVLLPLIRRVAAVGASSPDAARQSSTFKDERCGCSVVGT
jgi:hypothetical protein